MIRVMLCLRDTRAGMYLQPFFAPTVGYALRDLQDEMRKPDSPLGKHPGDYELHDLGSFDDDVGVVLVNEERPTLVAVLDKLIV